MTSHAYLIRYTHIRYGSKKSLQQNEYDFTYVEFGTDVFIVVAWGAGLDLPKGIIQGGLSIGTTAWLRLVNQFRHYT